jgi:hypothetical protein
VRHDGGVSEVNASKTGSGNLGDNNSPGSCPGFRKDQNNGFMALSVFPCRSILYSDLIELMGTEWTEGKERVRFESTLTSVKILARRLQGVIS